MIDDTFYEELFAFLKNKAKKYPAWIYLRIVIYFRNSRNSAILQTACRDGKKIVRGGEAATLSELEAIFCPCIDLWIGFMVLPKDW